MLRRTGKDLVYYLGAKIHEGQTLKGVFKGPEAVRDANLFQAINALQYNVKDLGDVSRDNLQQSQENLSEYQSKVNNLKYLDPLLHQVKQQVEIAAQQKNGFMLTVGGDHSIATGTIAGMKSVYNDLKVVWVDAHADIGIPHLTDSTTYHGKPVSHLMGLIRNQDIPGFQWLNKPLKPEDIVYIGIRDIDEDEKQTLVNHGIKCFTLDHILYYGGIGNVMEQTIQYLDPKKQGLPIHCSFDIDSIDPIYAPGTGTMSRGGLEYREAHYILKRLYLENFVGLDMVEINPELDPTKSKEQKLFGDDPHLNGSQTVQLGCELILSALGRNNVFNLNMK